MVLADRPDWIDWVAGLAPAVTTIVAIIAVVIASKALRASRESAANSARSLDKADAALRGAVRPVLSLTEMEGARSTILNAGPGVALDVKLILGASESRSDRAEDWLWNENPVTIPVIAPNAERTVNTIQFGSSAGGQYIAALVTCRDVNGEQHWLYRADTDDETDIATRLGVGHLPTDIERWQLLRPVRLR